MSTLLRIFHDGMFIIINTIIINSLIVIGTSLMMLTIDGVDSQEVQVEISRKGLILTIFLALACIPICIQFYRKIKKLPLLKPKPITVVIVCILGVLTFINQFTLYNNI